MDINKHIEHTLLKPNTSKTDIEQLCQEAIEFGFAAVCVPPFYVRTASDALKEHPIKTVTVIGYPMGYHAIPVKVEEIKRAIDEGVDEIDVVVNVAAIKDNNWSHIRNDIDSVTTAAHLKSKKARMIVEAELLTKQELSKLCEICKEVQVDGIKNTTDQVESTITLEMLKLLQDQSSDTPIVAAGALHNHAFAVALLEAGAKRISTTNALQLIK
ncbi:MAG: deoxyribose-phosphate aldolase [Aureispira sp.]